MSRRPLVVAALSAALVLLPSAALAETPSNPDTPVGADAASAPAALAPAAAESAAAAKPKSKPHRPKRAKVRIRIHHVQGGHALIMTKVPVTGTLHPWVRRQHVRVTFYLNGHKLFSKKVRVHRGPGRHGVFRTYIRLRQGGRYAVSARHAPNKALGGDRTDRKRWKITYPLISSGECSRAVRGFRLALNKLGYVPGGGRCFKGKMSRAVLAMRKVNNMSRNSHAGPRLVKLAFEGKGGYHVRHPGAGEHLEAPLSKQVLVFANDADVTAIYPISSGKPSTPTIQGHFNFYLSQPGYNAEGMYYSRYFIRGYAVHGYHSVPNYPASHGCLRTFISDQPEIYSRIFIGEDIFVF
jgi:hypothetical protein